MIIFDLACPHGHRFEGWFASGDEFDRQTERDLVRCPLCDAAGVTRIPSARVSVPKSAAAGRARPRTPTSGSTSATTTGTPPPAAPAGALPALAGLPAEVLAKLREIVRSTENVGQRFPEEARRMHYEEAPARPIRGEASPEEAEALRDEGIDVAPLPPFLLGDTH